MKNADEYFWPQIFLILNEYLDFRKVDVLHKTNMLFNEKTLFSTNATVKLVKCFKGYKSTLTKNNRFGCTVCPEQQYNVIPDGKCHDCPTIGAVCTGRDDVYAIPGYYGHIDESDGEFTTENIDEDDSSIYLTSDGLRGKSFEGQKIEGKNILIKSDSIFISISFLIGALGVAG